MRGTVRHATQDHGGSIYVVGMGNVWYRWQAPADGLFFASTTIDAMTLDVYEGATADTLQVLGVTVNGIRRGSSFYGTAGSNYWISVSGYNTELSTFELGVTAETPPLNDLFENRIVLSGPEVSIEGTSLGATWNPFEPQTFFRLQEYVWYSWTAPTSGLYRIAASLILPPLTNGGGGTPRSPLFNNWLIVSTGSVLTSLVEVVRGDAESGALLRANEGEWYQVAVPGRMSSFHFKITPVAVEPNDDYNNATLLDGVFTAGGSTLNATPEPGYPYSDRSVWFRWSAPSNGFYAITVTSGQSLSIYQGHEFATAQYLLGGPRPILRAASGEEFRIGVSPLSGGNGGPFLLRIDAVTPPANDDFANREILSGTNVAFITQVRDATVEPEEPGGSHTVWYSWTAPVEGLYALRFATNGGYARVFTGSELPSLYEIAADSRETFFEAEAGVTYHFSIDEFYSQDVDLSLELRKVAAPINDDFARRISLTGASVSTTGTLAGASLEPGDPGQIGLSRRSVWWSWTAPHSGRASIDFNPAGYHSTTVYTGDTLESLAPVTAGFWIDFPVEAGTTYQIAVTGDDNDVFPLNLTLVESPANDAFAGRKRLLRRGHGSTAGASRETGEPFYESDRLGASVWWKWRAPRNGVYDLIVSGYPSARIYRGDQLEALEPVGLSSSPGQAVRLRARAGVTYVIELSNPSGGGGEYQMRMVRRRSPVNDDFARRLEIAGTDVIVTGQNEFASVEPDEPGQGFYAPTHSVWWKWTAPKNGTAFVLFDESTRKRVTVFRGNHLAELETVAVSGPELLNFDVSAGVEYQIAIDSPRDGNDTPDPWQFQLLFIGPPINDSFAERSALTGAVVQAQGTVVGATPEAADALTGYGHSVWYSWSAPETGRYTIRSTSTNFGFGPILAVFSGEDLAALQLVAVGDTHANITEMNLLFQAGEQLAILIDDYARTPTDVFTLNIYKVDPPPNDDFADRANLINGRGTNSNEGATSEPQEPNGSYDPRVGSLWWRFTAASNGWHAVEAMLRLANGDQQWPQLGLFTGSDVTNLTPVYPTDGYPRPRWMLAAGIEYAIQVRDPERRLGTVEIEVAYPIPPSNDAWRDAIPITGDHTVAIGSNSWATFEPDEPPNYCCAMNSIWWRWIPPSNGLYLLAPDPGYLDIFTGSSLSNLTSIPGIVRNAQGYLFRASVGIEHFIRAISSGYAEGAITLHLDRVQPPANDDFTNRTLLVGSHISLLASNYYATAEPRDPLTESFGGQSVWWRWMAPASGTANLDFSGGLFGGVFRGDALTNLVPVSVIGSMSPQSFPVEAGVEYSIGLTTWFYSAGEFTLSLDAPEPEPPAAINLPLPIGIGSGKTSVIETSTNLIDWEPFRTNRPGEAAFHISPGTHERQRYFRVR